MVWRCCIDYRRLNKILRDNDMNYALSLIDQCLDNMHGAQWFTSCDISAAYQQLGVHPNSVPKTSFVTSTGQFEFLRVPFGIKSAPSLLSRLGDLIFKGLKWQIMNLYMDDILIFSQTFEDHIRDVSTVLQRLEEAGLTLNPTKCKWCQPEVDFLGYVVGRDGIKPNPAKLRAITEFPAPTDLSSLRSFLGLATYYRRFIRSFSTLASPLNQLLCKGVKWQWGPDQITAFKQLKHALTTAPVLVFPDFSKPFLIYTDASSYGVGAVLSQMHNGTEQVIAYGSKTLNVHERNYSVTHKEALALVWGVTKFRYYLYSKHFTVITDHKALKHLFETKDHTGQLYRWSLKLQEYDFNIEYRPGKNHQNADALSRAPLPDMDSVEDSLAIAAFWAEEALSAAIIGHVGDSLNFDDVPLPSSPLLRVHDDYALDWSFRGEVACLQRDDPQLYDYLFFLDPSRAHLRPEQRVPPGIKDVRQFIHLAQDYYLEGGDQLLMRIHHHGIARRRQDAFHQIVLPQALVSQVLQAYHEHPLSGHLAKDKMIEKIQKRYYWDSMDKDITHYCQSCLSCQSKKFPRNRPRIPLSSLPPVWVPFQRVGVDFLTVQESSSGKTKLLVFTDYLTRWVEAVPVEADNAEVAAREFFDRIICRFGCPHELLSDRGPSFTSKLMKEVAKIMQVEKTYITPLHPQANGLMERFNSTISTMLAIYVSNNPTDWDKYITPLLFAYNTSFTTATGETPYFLLYGRDPTLPIDVMFNTPSVPYHNMSGYSRALVKRLQQAFAAASANLHQSQQKARQRVADGQKAKKVLAFDVNDLVWLYTPVKSSKKLSSKLAHPWTGPWRVLEKVSDLVYLIRPVQGCNAKQPRRHRVHVSRLKSYIERRPMYPAIAVDRIPDDDLDEPLAADSRLPPLPQVPILPITAYSPVLHPPRDPTPHELSLKNQEFMIPDDPATYRVTSVMWSPQYAMVVANVVKLTPRHRHTRSTYQTTVTDSAAIPVVQSWIAHTTFFR